MDCANRLRVAKILRDRASDLAWEAGYSDESRWRRLRRLQHAVYHYEDTIRGFPRKPHKLVINCIYHPLEADGVTTSKWHRMACEWAEAKWSEMSRMRFFEKYRDLLES